MLFILRMVGMVPWKWLLVRCNFSKPDNDIISDGIDPRKPECDSNKRFNLVSLPISDGNVPVMEVQDEMSSRRRPFKFPISVGIDPRKYGCDFSRSTSSVVNIPISIGMPEQYCVGPAAPSPLEHMTALERSMRATSPFIQVMPKRSHSFTSVSAHDWYVGPQNRPRVST